MNTDRPAIEGQVQTVNVSEKYSFALDLIQYEIQRLWTIFGIFLLAETVLLGAVFQVFDNGPKGLVFAGALVGLLLVIPWWTTFENTRFFYLLRLKQAREFEPTVGSFLTEGQALADGKEVRGIRMSRFFRFMRPQRSGWFLMILFAVSFFVIALLKGLEIVRGAPSCQPQSSPVSLAA